MNDSELIFEDFLGRCDTILGAFTTPLKKHYEISNIITWFEWTYEETETEFSKLRIEMAGFFPNRDFKKNYTKKIEACLNLQVK